MRTHPRWFLLPLAAALLAGCSAAPAPQSATPPPSTADTPPGYVSGAPDTTGPVPGSASSPYVFRFKQVEPSSDRFTFRDRDVTFYFRPGPTALYFKVENLQGRPIWIDWDKSQFLDANGRTGKVAHSTTRWNNRFNAQAMTQVPGQQQYGDYVIPLESLIDPGAAAGQDEQPHLPLLPEDSSAPTFSGRSFGVDLAFTIDDRPRVYTFRFQVASVIPR